MSLIEVTDALKPRQPQYRVEDGIRYQWIDPETRRWLEKLGGYYQLLADPQGTEERCNEHHSPGGLCISAVYDDNGQVIPGVLCYDTGQEGPSAAVIAMTHMCEPAGLAAQLDFHQRFIQAAANPDYDWEKNPAGLPSHGKVYAVIGGEVPSCGELFDFALGDEWLKVHEISEFREGTHPAGRERGLIRRNSNRVRPELLQGDTPQNEQEARLVALKRQVFDLCEGNLFDLHTTSQPTSQVIYIPYGDEPPAGTSKTDQEKSHLAMAETLHPFLMAGREEEGGEQASVLLDIMHTLNGKPIIAAGERESGNVPLSIEAGGPHLFWNSFEFASRTGRQWLDYVFDSARKMVSPEEINPEEWWQTRQYDRKLHYYHNTVPIFHPRMYAKHQDILPRSAENPWKDEVFTPAELNDTYVLIHHPGVLADKTVPWTEKGKQALLRLIDRELDSKPDITKAGMNRLSGFQLLDGGSALMVGAQTGKVLTMPRSMFHVMAPVNAAMPPERTEAIIFGMDCPQRLWKAPTDVMEALGLAGMQNQKKLWLYPHDGDANLRRVMPGDFGITAI